MPRLTIWSDGMPSHAFCRYGDDGRAVWANRAGSAKSHQKL
jgi:hypothetical protein